MMQVHALDQFRGSTLVTVGVVRDLLRLSSDFARADHFHHSRESNRQTRAGGFRRGSSHRREPRS